MEPSEEQVILPDTGMQAFASYQLRARTEYRNLIMHLFIQESLHEPQPQALPYAAALVDPELSETVQSVDQGIEHGLATSAVTDQADVAYTQQGHSAEVVDKAGPTSEADAATGAGASVLKVEIADTACLAVNNQVAEQVVTLLLLHVQCYSAAYLNGTALFVLLEKSKSKCIDSACRPLRVHSTFCYTQTWYPCDTF